MIFTDLSSCLERAARNGEKAHLSTEMARALIASPAWRIITAAATKELVDSWADADHPETRPKPKRGSDSDRSGSTTEPTETTGASAGTIPKHVHGAAEARALEQARVLSRPRPRAKPSPGTISNPAGQQSPKLKATQ